MFHSHNDKAFPFEMGFGRGRGFGRERLMRGHLNMIILEIIKERPRHGYDVIKAIEEKFHGFYSPSAGSVYPILQELADHDFVTSSEESGKKIYSITKEGERELKANKDKFSDMREHLRHRLGDMGRYSELMREIGYMTHFVFGKLRERGTSDTETIKQLRIAIANFKSEVEEILASRKGLTMDQDRITELINKSEITSIVNSYFRALDEKNLDAQHFASIFTPQAKVTRPNGASIIGPDEISASHEKSFTRFEGSQHFVAGHDISLDGSTANVRANLIAMHMWQGSKTDANKLDNFFIAGGVIHATLMQSDGRWRISQMSNVVLWRAGGFRDMMQTGTVTKEP